MDESTGKRLRTPAGLSGPAKRERLDHVEPASEDNKRKLVEQAFRQASFSMSVFDTEQRYRRLNEVACQVMGVDESALLGHPFPYGVPLDVSQQAIVDGLREVVDTGKPVHS